MIFSMAVVGGLASVSGALCRRGPHPAADHLIGASWHQGRRWRPAATGALLLGVLLRSPAESARRSSGHATASCNASPRRHGIHVRGGRRRGDRPSLDAEDAAAGRGRPRRRLRRWCRTDPSCRDLTASYGALQVLFGVDLEVARRRDRRPARHQRRRQVDRVQGDHRLMAEVDGPSSSTALRRKLATHEVAAEGSR